MKKRIWALILAAIMIFSTILTGCSPQTEEKESDSSSESSQAEIESSSEPKESSSQSSDGGTTDIIDPPSSSSAPETSSSVPETSSSIPSSSSEAAPEGITGALVANTPDSFGFGSENVVLGTDADLNAWYKAISQRDSIAKILVSTWNAERDLTQDEISTVLDTLENLSPTVMDEPRNPATGGATNVVAFDRDGNFMWGVTLAVDWLFVQVAGDTSMRILEINEADAAPIYQIA